MNNVSKKIALASALVCLTPALGGCAHDTERLMYGMAGGAAIGAGIGSIGGGSILPGAAAGAMIGATAAVLTE